MLSYNLPFFVLLFYPKSSRLYHRNRHFSTPYAKKMYKTNLKYFFWIFLIVLIFSIDIIQFLSYYKWAVDERSKQSKASRLKKCRNGGIGRRAGFRCLWSQDRVGSSPISCILFYFIQNQKNRSAQHRHFCFFIYFSFSEKISLPPQRSAPVNMKRSEILNTTFLSFGFSTFRLT